MQGNITINLQNGSSQGWNGYPNDCEKQRAAEALTAETGLGGNPSKPDWACEDEGFPGVADNKNCCNRLTAYTWTPSNIKPTGHITTLNGTVIPIGGSGTFTIHADDLDGEVTRVGWYVGGNLVYTAFSAPWSFPYSNAPAGQYTLSAAIYDTADVYVWSTNTVTVSVGGYFATDTLQTGEHLFPGYVLVAPNQAYYAQLGSDGRFNLYTATSALVASTWTYGPPLYVRMNEDGNAVVRHQPFVDVFQTGTGSQTNAESGLRVLNSGSLAIVRRNGTIVGQYP
jgi:hypothetical protein